MHRKTLRVVTYNIHRCRGMDGRTVPERSIEVLSSLKADIIALQEVIGAGPDDSGHAAEIGAALGMGWVMASARHLRTHQFGNVVLSHYPIRQHVQYDLSWRTCEPRTCQRADIVIDATGSNKSMSHALNYAAFAGRVVYVGITQQELTFPHAPIMHRRELTLCASRNALPPDFTRIIQLIEQGQIDTRPWITHQSPFADLIANFPSYTQPETGVIKAIVTVE